MIKHLDARWLATASVLVGFCAMPAAAQTTTTTDVGATTDAPAADATTIAQGPSTPQTVAPDGEVIVTGFRQSLRSAQAIKKNATEIVDSIVAEDIGKLPDNNLSEALQRVPGVQISRNHGEGSGIAIRGLSQVKTLVNGREVFSDTGRDLSLENVPAEILAGVDVYKNPSATLVEGGLGGVVNLKTRRPFDFKGFQASINGRYNNYDLIDKWTPQISGLISNRFDTSIGEVGFLIGAAMIKSAGRLDSNASEPFEERCNIVDFDNDGVFIGRNGPNSCTAAGADLGDKVIAPQGGGNSVEITERKRSAVYSTLQFRPRPNLELYLEGTYNKYIYEGTSGLAYANRGTRPALAGAPFTFWEGTNVVKSGTYRDVQFTAGNNYFDRDAYTWQIAGGGTWNVSKNLDIIADVSFTKSRRYDRGGGIRAGTTAAQAVGTRLFFDNSTEIVTLDLTGIDFNNLANYSFLDSFENKERAEGQGSSARFDAVYKFDNSPLTSASLGFRVASRDVLRQQGGDSHFSGAQPSSLLPQILEVSDYADDFFRGLKIPQPISTVYAANLDLLRDTELLCRTFNDPTCQPTYIPANRYGMDEKTAAIFGQVNFDFADVGFALDGNAGFRFVRTKLGVFGTRTRPASPGAPSIVEPIDQNTSYKNFLPSLNLRYKFTPDLFLRFAAAKQLTRPNFGDLRPTLGLSFNNSSGLFTGSAGNPDLRPLRSTSFDLSGEWYFSRNGYLYAAAFLRKVDGFIQGTIVRETISIPEFPGVDFADINRPVNGDNGEIKGAEIGIQTFFDFLPSPLDGFGAQANFTRVKSSAPGPIAGQSVPLQGLSERSYNLVGFYEKYGFRARLAYNYRSDYVETTSGPGSGNLPIFSAPYNQLDGSVGYTFNKNIDVSIDATNLTKSMTKSYFGEEIRPRFKTIADRRIGISLRLKN
jgi:TonB-dependent receptor